jgi:integrase
MRHHGNLYPRNRGRVFCFRYKDKDGRWREKSTSTNDRKQALKFKKDFDKENEEGRLPGDKQSWTVEQACTEFVKNHKLATASAKASERCLMRALIRPLGAKKLKDITLDDLKGYQVQREKVSNRTINLELRILVRVLKEENLWKHSLKEFYKILPEAEGDIGKALTVEQLARLEQTAKSNDRWFVAYSAEILAANSGMRGGEIRRTTLGAVDLEHRCIYIRRKATKTNKGARIVELNTYALAAVTKLYERAQLLGATSADHYLLPADLSKHVKTGDPLKDRRGFDVTEHQQGWRTAWGNLRKKAGLEDVRFHDLRHTFITRMAENNVPLPVVRAMVGHMNEKVTERYTHISSNAARRAVELLEKIHIQPHFVDEFVDAAPAEKANLLQ